MRFTWPLPAGVAAIFAMGIFRFVFWYHERCQLFLLYQTWDHCKTSVDRSYRYTYTGSKGLDKFDWKRFVRIVPVTSDCDLNWFIYHTSIFSISSSTVIDLSFKSSILISRLTVNLSLFHYCVLFFSASRGPVLYTLVSCTASFLALAGVYLLFWFQYFELYTNCSCKSWSNINLRKNVHL